MGILQCKKNEIPMISEIESQILAFFDSSPLIQTQNSIISFEYICWFFGKNLSYFVSPVWKLHNLYCQTDYYAILLWIRGIFDIKC